MPPKRSARLRNPSARAVKGPQGANLPVRSLRAASQLTTNVQGSSTRTGTDQPPPSNTAPDEPQPLSLPPGVLDQLVARVADEVTRRLSPPEVTNANPVSDTTRPSALSEVPLVSAPPAAAVQVPGLVVANQGMAGTIVQRSLGTTHTSLSGGYIQAFGASPHGTGANGHSCASAASELAPVISKLLQSSLQPSSLPTYQRAWKLFSQFLHVILPGISTTLPISPPVLALFIAYMYDRHYATSTVSTYVSALGYCHKLSGFPDPTKAFFIVQMLKGYGKLGSRLDSRLPITLPILHRILGSSVQFCHTLYDNCLFQAMCSLSFFACMRVGEITSTTTKERGSLIQLHQLTQLVDANQGVVALKFTFRDFKHNYNQRPFSVVINRRNNLCPVEIILDYLSLRGDRPGPLFRLADGSPISRAIFIDKLSVAIKYCGLDPSRYKGHSFRIGAASFAADAGMSDAQSRALGRWKSNAFQKYIRIPSLTS